MTRFPSSSRILQRAVGYRELLEAWRAFRLSADPFATLENALDVRDVATLYEWWCFFELTDQISALKSPQKDLRYEVEDIAGLRAGITVSFDGGWELVYNRTFCRGGGLWGSYSLPLRPDFVLAENGVPLIGLDAKFRFQIEKLSGAIEHEDAQVDEDSQTAESALRLADPTDLYKMHAYRDALGLRCVVVIYPGYETAFYEPSGAKRESLALPDLLEEPSPAGVGVLPLSPEG